MAPSTKKRKLTSFESSKAATIVPFGRSIAALGKISKPTAAPSSGKVEQISTEDAHVLESLPQPAAERRGVKRKHGTQPATPRKAAKQAKRETADSRPAGSSLPLKSRQKTIAESTAPKTPTKGARTCLEAFVLGSRFSSGSRSSSPGTPSSSAPKRKRAENVPEAVEELIDLHGAFLTALSLHYAHHGTSAPVDLRLLKPGIQKAWGKRAVGTDDIRRLLGLQQPEDQAGDGSPAMLSLWAYGPGKICLELRADDLPSSAHRQPLDVDRLRAAFGAKIDSLVAQGPLAPLPLAPLHSRPSTGTGTLGAGRSGKGQLRLTELKAGAILAQSRSSCAPAPAPTSTSTPRRTDSLLDRIRAKEALRNTQPAPATKASLERTAALQRTEEAIGVLSVLGSNSSRGGGGGGGGDDSDLGLLAGLGGLQQRRTTSVSMATVVQHLQMSMRHPISREEAERCVRLLGDEVAPGWVTVRDVGRVTGVVLRGVLGREWKGALERALAK